MTTVTLIDLNLVPHQHHVHVVRSVLIHDGRIWRQVAYPPGGGNAAFMDTGIAA